ncbi:MAG: hypothetical protein ACREHC_00440 [Candidatus Levyibacteriota bacterium]
MAVEAPQRPKQDVLGVQRTDKVAPPDRRLGKLRNFEPSLNDLVGYLGSDTTRPAGEVNPTAIANTEPFKVVRFSNLIQTGENSTGAGAPLELNGIRSTKTTTETSKPEAATTESWCKYECCNKAEIGEITLKAGATLELTGLKSNQTDTETTAPQMATTASWCKFECCPQDPPGDGNGKPTNPTPRRDDPPKKDEPPDKK